jgi:hypothetical protein
VVVDRVVQVELRRSLSELYWQVMVMAMNWTPVFRSGIQNERSWRR